MIALQLANFSITDFLIDKGADIIVGLIIAALVGICAYFLGAGNEKKKQKVQNKIDLENEKKLFQELYPQLKNEIEANMKIAIQLRDFLSMRHHLASEAFTWTESRKLSRSFSKKVFNRFNEAKVQRYINPELYVKIDDIYHKLAEWSSSIDASREVSIGINSNKELEDLVYVELITAGYILRDFDELIKAMN